MSATDELIAKGKSRIVRFRLRITRIMENLAGVELAAVTPTAGDSLEWVLDKWAGAVTVSVSSAWTALAATITSFNTFASSVLTTGLLYGRTKLGDNVTETVVGDTAVTSVHDGAILVVDSGSPVTLTLAANLRTNFSLGVVQKGAGRVTIAATGPAVIRSAGGLVKTTGQYSVARLVKSGDDVYLDGDLAA